MVEVAADGSLAQVEGSPMEVVRHIASQGSQDPAGTHMDQSVGWAGGRRGSQTAADEGRSEAAAAVAADGLILDVVRVVAVGVAESE